MASFEEYRKKMNTKYGSKNKEEDEEKNNFSSSPSVSSADSTESFSSMRKRLNEKYNTAKNVDADYINSFLRDSEDYLKSAEKDYSSMGVGTGSSIYESRKKTAEDLNSRSSAIKQYLEKYRDNIDSKTYDSLSKYLDDFGVSSAQIGYAFYDAKQKLDLENPDNRLRMYESMKDRLEAIEAEMKTASKGDLISLTDEKKKLEDSVRQYERTQYKADSYYNIYRKKGFDSISSNRNFNTPSRDEFKTMCVWTAAPGIMTPEASYIMLSERLLRTATFIPLLTAHGS